MTTLTHFFASDKQLRDQRCIEKDKIVKSVIDSLPIKSPKDFTAVLMPAAYGPEVRRLRTLGVPYKNMFAIERDPAIRRMQIDRGLRVPYKAFPAQFAVDHIPFEKVDFCYLDFLGRPSTSHLETLRKVMRLGLLQKGSCLLVTLGVNRGDRISTPILDNSKAYRGKGSYYQRKALGKEYVLAALEWVCNVQPRSVKSFEYTSTAHIMHIARFTTTEIRF